VYTPWYRNKGLSGFSVAGTTGPFPIAEQCSLGTLPLCRRLLIYSPEILMEGLQGASLRVKLRNIEPWTEARRASATKYNDLLRVPG